MWYASVHLRYPIIDHSVNFGGQRHPIFISNFHSNVRKPWPGLVPFGWEHVYQLNYSWVGSSQDTNMNLPLKLVCLVVGAIWIDKFLHFLLKNAENYKREKKMQFFVVVAFLLVLSFEEIIIWPELSSPPSFRIQGGWSELYGRNWTDERKSLGLI